VQLGISRMLSRDWTLALMGSFARTDAPQIAGLQTACVYTTNMEARKSPAAWVVMPRLI